METCDFHNDHDPANDRPRGTRCGKPATWFIGWEDGRYSYACDGHTNIGADASVKPSVVRAISSGGESG